jgi:hypothetical protein
MHSRSDIWHTGPRSRKLSIIAAIGRFILPPLVFVSAAALPLHARAQAQSAPESAPSDPPAGEQPAAAPVPVPADAVAGPAAKEDGEDAPTQEQVPARDQVPEPPATPEEQEASPPPSSEAPAPTPPTAVPATAEPAAATAATASASPPAEVEEDEKPTVPWIATLSWNQAYNAAGLSRGGNQTFNPEYAWSFNVVLGYRFDDRTSIALSQTLALELTDSDVTNTRQEPWLLDTAIDGKRELVDYELDADHALRATGTLGILLPTSKPSQAATMLFGGRVKLGGEYAAEDVLHGLSAGASFSYTRRFLRSNVIEVDSRFPCVEGDLQDTTRSCAHLGSLTNTRDLFVLGFEGDLGLTDKLTLGAQVSFGWNLGAGLRDQSLGVAGSRDGVVEVGDGSLTHWRNSRVIGLSVEYAFTDWFSGATLLTNSFAERSPDDGQYRAPFNAQDMFLGLELSVSFDQLYEATRGHAAGD